MKYTKEYAGKWVATTDKSVVFAGKTLKSVMSKVKNRPDSTKIRFTLVPKGLMTGSAI